MGPDAGPNFVCLKLGIQFLRHAGIPESRCDQNDHRRAEKVLGANKGHWEFRSFMEGPKLAFGDTKDDIFNPIFTNARRTITKFQHFLNPKFLSARTANFFNNFDLG